MNSSELNYFLTVTFKNDQLRNDLPIRQIRKTLMYIWTKLEKHCEEYKFCIEFTLSNAIHYHIIYLPLNKGHQITMLGCFKKFGNCKNEIIKNYQYTYEYLSKDISAIKQLVEYYYKDDINDKNIYDRTDYIFDTDSKKMIQNITRIRKVPFKVKKKPLVTDTDENEDIMKLLMND